MRKLARNLGVTAPALYRHFESKEQVLHEVVREAYERFARHLYTALEGQTPLERFELAGEGYLGFALAHPRLFEVLFAAPDPTDLEAASDLASRLTDAAPGGVLGVAIHAVESVAEAKAAFERVAGPFEAKKGRPIRSYGLLLDDLLVYRGVVERRPVVLSHPQSLAARALADLAGLVLADARDPGTRP